MPARPIEWLAIVTNLSVLGGLVLVAYQVSQTNEALDRESREWSTEISFDSNEMMRETRAMLIEHADVWVRGGNGESLSEADAVRYGELVNQLMWANIQIVTVNCTRNRGRGNLSVTRQLLRSLDGKPGHLASLELWRARTASGFLGSLFRTIDYVRSHEDTHEGPFEGEPRSFCPP